MRRIALITPTHLARNPRLVKEADALAAAGYEVDVFYCRFMADVVEHDRMIEARALWRPRPLSYLREEAPWRFWTSRLRQHACRRAFDRYPVSGGPPDWLALRAFERVYPELLRMVSAHEADLYVAHNLQALPVAYHAARRHGATLGFDAEDFHTGMFLPRERGSRARRLVTQVEDRFIRACDYLTAAAPLISKAYADRYGVKMPTTVLNVFPSALRPATFRPTDSGGPLTLYWFSQTIGPVRGLEDAARAMSMLADLPIELHLRGRAHDPDYVPYLRALAGDAGRRIVVHDLAPADEMIRLAAEYDVGLALETPVEPNRALCLSNKIFSYLAAGNAVLATATPAQQALMKRLGAAGAIYPPGNARALAVQVRQWHESRDLLEGCRRNAWQAATQRFNWEHEQRHLLRVINGLFDDRFGNSDPGGGRGGSDASQGRDGSVAEIAVDLDDGAFSSDRSDGERPVRSEAA